MNELYQLLKEENKVRDNYFSKRGKIPMLINSYRGTNKHEKIVTMDAPKSSEVIIIIGGARSGKSVVGKNWLTWAANVYKRKIFMIDPKGYDLSLCKYPNSKTEGMLRSLRIEKDRPPVKIIDPQGISDLSIYSPIYNQDVIRKGEKLLGFLPSDLKVRGWRTLNATEGSSFQLSDIAKNGENKNIAKNMLKFYNYVKSLPTNKLEAEREAQDYWLPTQTQNKMLFILSLLIEDKFFPDQETFYFTIDQMLMQLNESSVLLNSYSTGSYLMACTGAVIERLIQLRKEKKIPLVVNYFDEAHNLAPQSDNNKEFSSTKMLTELITEEQKHGFVNVFITQYPSNLHRDLFSTAKYFIITGKLTGDDYTLLSKILPVNVVNLIKTLRRDKREFLIYDNFKDIISTGYGIMPPCEIHREEKVSGET